MARSSDYKGEDLITPISRINIRRVCQAIPGRHDVRYSASERDTRKYESGEICRIQEMDQGDTLTGNIILLAGPPVETFNTLSVRSRAARLTRVVTRVRG